MTNYPLMIETFSIQRAIAFQHSAFDVAVLSQMDVTAMNGHRLVVFRLRKAWPQLVWKSSSFQQNSFSFINVENRRNNNIIIKEKKWYKVCNKSTPDMNFRSEDQYGVSERVEMLVYLGTNTLVRARTQIDSKENRDRVTILRYSKVSWT